MLYKKIEITEARPLREGGGGKALATKKKELLFFLRLPSVSLIIAVR